MGRINGRAERGDEHYKHRIGEVTAENKFCYGLERRDNKGSGAWLDSCKSFVLRIGKPRSAFGVRYLVPNPAISSDHQVDFTNNAFVRLPHNTRVQSLNHLSVSSRPERTALGEIASLDRHNLSSLPTSVIHCPPRSTVHSFRVTENQPLSSFHVSTKGCRDS